MFGAKPKPIEETTIKDIWISFFAGTLIGGGILVSSFFSKQPEWFLWIARCFMAVFLVGWWRSTFRCRRALAEYQSKMKSLTPNKSPEARR